MLQELYCHLMYYVTSCIGWLYVLQLQQNEMLYSVQHLPCPLEHQ